MCIIHRKSYTLRMKSRALELGRRTLVMGILNVTPDSFSDGGQFFGFQPAVRQATEMISAGADLLDIGGESTRPDSEPVPLKVEIERVIPVIEAIRENSTIPISVDTTKAEVARRAIEAGADIINDVSALRFDDEMPAAVASLGVPLILMHMQGTPRTMQKAPAYASLFSEIISFLEERIQFAVSHGVSRHQIIVDPGIGFGKTVAHNLLIIRDLELLQTLDRPVLLGTSRKRYIGTVLNRPVEDREIGTAVAHALGLHAGAHILRVHDVPLHCQVATMADAFRNAHADG